MFGQRGTNFGTSHIMLLEEDKALSILHNQKKGGEFMEFVKMPELLSAETAKVLAGNVDAVKNALRDEVGGACGGGSRDEICCPKKVKFIIFLSNVAIFNMNAVAEEDNRRRPQ